MCLPQRPDTLTTGAGHPVGDKLNLQTAGPRGPLLVQDVVFTDEMAHFDRERIPERVVHAKGGGECPCLCLLSVSVISGYSGIFIFLRTEEFNLLIISYHKTDTVASSTSSLS